MTAELSQPTLGLLRRILEGMEPAYAVALFDRKKFWKDQLFDFDFPPKVIEIAVSYEFRWGDIISDLFIGKFGLQNQHFADALPPYFCEQTLKRLLALALHEGTDSVLINQLDESLKREGVEVTWTDKPTAQSTEAQTGRAAPKTAPANSVNDASSRGSAQNPVAFISYSWDSAAHKKWVLDLACRLRKDGVQIILDQWHLQPGHDRTLFMEESVTKSDFVILICTPDYARKANSREGGVGYEATIITGELADSIAQGKFIPILRGGDWKSSLPVWIKTKVGVDLRGNPYSDEQYQDLLRALHKEPVKPPPVGPRPVFGNSGPVDQEIVPPDWAVRAVLLDEDQSSWPDVILECQWPSLVHEPRISGSHIVRKRPWMLRHGGPGAVYNVCVHDIDFGEYKARFPSVRTLTDTASVHAIICWKSDGLVIDAHDLESLIHNPPSGCDVQQYAVKTDGSEGEEIRLEDFVLEVEIPVTISYDDKNGNRFKIKYLLHYDTYMEEGEMIRIGRIEKVG